MTNFLQQGWNIDSVRKDSKTIISKISIGWRNFRKQGVWTSIDERILPDFTVSSFPASADFAKSSQEWSDFVFDSSYSIKRAIEDPVSLGFNAEPNFSLSLCVETERNIEGFIDENHPSSIIYKNAWNGADLVLGIWRGLSTRIEKVVHIREVPSGDEEYVKYSFLLRSSNAKAWVGGSEGIRPWDGKTTASVDLYNTQAFVSLGDSKIRGVLIKNPVCWWYDEQGEIIRHNIKVNFELLSDGETVRCTKFIPRQLILNAFSDGSYLRTDITFVPDADPETKSMDFWTQRSVAGQTWTQLSTGNGNGASASNTSGYIRMRSDTTTNRFNLLNRANFFFDTSSLSGLVTSCLLKYYIFSSSNPSPFWSSSLNIYGSSSTNTTVPTTSDFQAVQSTPLATEITSGSVNSAGYNTFTMNAAGRAAVNTSGLSRFVSILSTYDLDVATPTWASNVTHFYRNYYAEQGSSFSPELEVTTVPIVNTAHPAFMLLLT